MQLSYRTSTNKERVTVECHTFYIDTEGAEYLQPDPSRGTILHYYAKDGSRHTVDHIIYLDAEVGS